MNISLAAETIAHIGSFPISNSLLTTWVVMVLIIVLSYFATKKVSLIPSGLQNVMEIIVESLYNLTQSVAGLKAKRIFPLVATIFLFVLFSNWLGLFPGLNAIGFFHEIEGHKEFIPLFRSPSADLNTTLALALIAVFSVQYFGLSIQGKSYLGKFINLKSPIKAYVGILEIIGEFSRIISFTFRLFGNVFAGEVLLTVIAFLMPVIAPAPFLIMEIFVGFIQALVFAMLTLVLINSATESHEEAL